MADNSFMTTSDVCNHLRMSSRTLERRRKRERLPFPEPDYSGLGSENKWYRYKVLEWQEQDININRARPKELSGSQRDESGRVIQK